MKHLKNIMPGILTISAYLFYIAVCIGLRILIYPKIFGKIFSNKPGLVNAATVILIIFDCIMAFFSLSKVSLSDNIKD